MHEKEGTDISDTALAIGQIPIGQLIASHPELIRDLQSIDCFDATSKYAGFLTIPALQTRCSRLEALVHLAIGFATGDHPLTMAKANEAFNELGDGLCGAMEDPPEDAFSTVVTSSRGNYRIIEGIWESASFFLQRVVNITEQLPTENGWEQMSESMFALLTLSDAICERSNLSHTTFGTDAPSECLAFDEHGDIQNRVIFKPDDLNALGVKIEAIEPFIFQPSLSNVIPSTSLQHSPLLDYPLLRSGDRIVCALPTAISIAIRRFVLGNMIERGFQKEAVELLADEYHRLFEYRPLFNIGRNLPIFFRENGECHIAEYGTQIEPGRFVHFIFVLDSLRGFEKDGFAGLAPSEPKPGFFSERIAAFRRYAEQSETVKEGVTFIVSCGLGRASFGMMPELSSDAAGDWYTVFLSAPDAETLTLLEVTPQTVLRVFRAKQVLARQGVKLFNPNGFPNLLAWVKSLDGHLIDHRNMPDELQARALHLFLPTDMVLNLRKERAKIDRHMASLPDGSLVRVCHLKDSCFEEEAKRPLYIDEHFDEAHGFRLVYRGKQLDCWCEVFPRQYDRWKMLCMWLPRIGEALSSHVVDYPHPSLLFQIHFDSLYFSKKKTFEFPELKVPKAEEIAESISIEIDREKFRVIVRVGILFEHGLAHPDNISESMLVQRMVEGALILLFGSVDAEAVRSVHNTIVPNTDARHAHFFQPHQFRNFVQESIPNTPVVVDSIDEATNRLGLGWRFRSPEEGQNVIGKENCATFLNNVVRGIEDDLCSDLKTFDRKQLIRFALLHHEAAMVNQQRWRTTARANLAFQSDRAGAQQTILNKEFENNASLVASRVLVELAVCECPTVGGIMPGETDLSRLMSKLLLVIHFGGWSDAIFFDAMEPSLRITPLGDIHGNVTFLTDVVMPFGKLSGDVMLRNEIDRYSSNFAAPKTTPTINDAFDPRFLVAWGLEKGLSIDDYRKFADKLEDLGISKQQAVFNMKWLELAEHFQEVLPIWEEIIKSLLLRPRPSWREVPEGFLEKELWPWRYRRQLSLVRRPIVQLDTNANPELIIVPGLIRDAIINTVRGYYEGSFYQDQLVSEEMRSWFGAMANKRGHAFTKIVLEHVKERGWEAEADVPMRRILTGRKNDRLGDIDVLSWNTTTNRVLLLECKDLHFHKTIGELAEQVQDYRGQTKGRKRDDMLKHIDRTNAIHTKIEALQNYIGIRDELKVESWIVFKYPVPVLLSWIEVNSGVRVTTFDQLSAILRA